jgi:phage-related protein
MSSPQVKRTNIPGRNGDLLDDYDNYNNITVTYPCSCVAADINTVLDAIGDNYLSVTKYAQLIDTYHPDVFRMAIPAGNITPTVLRPNAGSPHRAANFNLSFSCKPQKFLVDGAIGIQIAAGGSHTFHNPTGFKAKPLLYVTGHGTVSVGDQAITIDSTCPENTLFIDCELMDAYGDGNLNPYVSMPVEDVVLPAGDTTIVATGCSVVVTPRWWRV